MGQTRITEGARAKQGCNPAWSVPAIQALPPPKKQKAAGSSRVSPAATTLSTHGRAVRKFWFPLETPRTPRHCYTPGTPPFSQKDVKSRRINKNQQDAILQVQL